MLNNKTFLLLVVLLFFFHPAFSQITGDGDNLGDYFSGCMAGNCPPSYPAVPLGAPYPYTYFDKAFSAYVGGNFYVPATGGGETEGKLAVGGNLILEKSSYTIGASGGGSQVVGPQDFTDSWATNNFDDDNLIVGGNVSGNQTNYIGGDAIIGGSLLGTTNIGQAYSVYDFTQTGVGLSNVGIDFSMVNDYLYLRSITFKEESNTGTISNSWGTYTFNGDGTSNPQVFNINENISGWGIDFTNIPSGATVLINIAGTTRTWSISGYITGISREYVLLNFYEATSVSLSGEIDGSVLVPLTSATTTLTGNLHGRFLTGGNFNHTGGGVEIHNYPFSGNLPEIDESTLPIDLWDFSSKQTGKSIELSWITANTYYDGHFILQRSSDNQFFTDIYQIKQLDRNQNVYRHTDYPNSNGVLYYRLIQKDIDGKTNFSKTISVSYENTSLSIIHNYISNKELFLTLNSANNTQARMQLYDLSGKLVMEKDFLCNEGVNNQTFNLSNISSGVFILHVSTKDSYTVKKITI